MDLKKITLFSNENEELNEELNAAISYVGRHTDDLRKGSILMTSVLKSLHDQPSPFIMMFGKFHFKHLKNEKFSKWGTMVVAIASVDWTYMRFVHIQVICNEIEKSGGEAIQHGVREVYHFLKGHQMTKYLVGAVADKNRANGEAISWLTSQKCPVVYDHWHLCGTLSRAGFCDALLRHLYRSTHFTKETYIAVIDDYMSVAAGVEHDPARTVYKNELPRIKCMLKHIFDLQPEKVISLTNVNSDLFKDIGQKWSVQMEVSLMEAFAEFKDEVQIAEGAIQLVTSMVTILARLEAPYDILHKLEESGGLNEQ